MDLSFNISDSYTRRARLQPALLVAVPIALAVLACFPEGLVGWGVLWSLLVACGGTMLLSQMARDRGKDKEPELFQMWGGKPTTQLLRHHNTRNRVLLARRHAKLAVLIPSMVIPTAEEEASNPVYADEVYDACTAFLLEKTRDKKIFSLLFEENCSYGFRRNLWGMRPLGVMTSVVCPLVVSVGMLFGYVLPKPLAISCLSLDLLLFLGWIAWFTPAWVRIAADAFAERLLASCDSLETSHTKETL